MQSAHFLSESMDGLFFVRAGDLIASISCALFGNILIYWSVSRALNRGSAVPGTLSLDIPPRRDRHTIQGQHFHISLFDNAHFIAPLTTRKNNHFKHIIYKYVAKYTRFQCETLEIFKSLKNKALVSLFVHIQKRKN